MLLRRWLCLAAAFFILVVGGGVAYADPSPSPSPSKPATLHDVWGYDWIVGDKVDCSKADIGMRITCESIDKPGVLGMDGKIHCDKYGYGYSDDFGAKRAACLIAKGSSWLVTKAIPGADPIEGITTNPKDLVDWAAKKGLEQVISATAESASSMFQETAKLIFTMTAPNLYSNAYVSVYNAVAGVMVALVFLFFVAAIISNTISPKSEGVGTTLGGLLRAVMGISLAAVIAHMMVSLADEATTALLAKNQQDGDWANSSWSTALKQLADTPGMAVVALIAAALAIVGLLALMVMMFMRGVMIYAAGIIGAIAMVGQAHPATRAWARQWFTTICALAWSKFVIAALWLLAGKLITGEGIVPVLSGLAMIWVMVYAPNALIKMFSFLDVQIAGGIDGGGAGKSMLDKLGNSFGGGANSGGGPGSSASPETLMKEAIDDVEGGGGKGKPRGAGAGSGNGDKSSDTAAQDALKNADQGKDEQKRGAGGDGQESAAIPGAGDGSPEGAPGGHPDGGPGEGLTSASGSESRAGVPGARAGQLATSGAEGSSSGAGGRSSGSGSAAGGSSSGAPVPSSGDSGGGAPPPISVGSGGQEISGGYRSSDGADGAAAQGAMSE